MKFRGSPHNRTCSELVAYGVALFTGAVSGGIYAIMHFFG